MLDCENRGAQATSAHAWQLEKAVSGGGKSSEAAAVLVSIQLPATGVADNNSVASAEMMQNIITMHNVHTTQGMRNKLFP